MVVDVKLKEAKFDFHHELNLVPFGTPWMLKLRHILVKLSCLKNKYISKGFRWSVQQEGPNNSKGFIGVNCFLYFHKFLFFSSLVVSCGRWSLSSSKDITFIFPPYWTYLCLWCNWCLWFWLEQFHHLVSLVFVLLGVKKMQKTFFFKST